MAPQLRRPTHPPQPTHAQHPAGTVGPGTHILIPSPTFPTKTVLQQLGGARVPCDPDRTLEGALSFSGVHMPLHRDTWVNKMAL